MASSGARTQPPHAALATAGVKLSTGGSLCCCSPLPITRAVLLWEVLGSFLQGFSTSPALVDSLAGVNWAGRWCWLGLSPS